MTRSLRFVVFADVDRHADLRWVGHHRGVDVVAFFKPHELSTYSQRLKQGDIHGVYLATHPMNQPNAAIEAAQRHVHVFCEGPMALTHKHCESMIAACTEHNRHLMVGRRLYFQPARAYLREVLESQSLVPRVFSAVHQSTMDVSHSDLLHTAVHDYLNAAYDVFDSWPTFIEHASRSTANLSVVMRFQSAVSTFVGSVGCAHSQATLLSRDEAITVSGMFDHFSSAIVTTRASSRSFRPLNPIVAEVDRFVRTIRRDLSPVLPFSAAHGMNLVKVTENIERQLMRP
jgi:predicted dehydrogenase